MTPEELWVICDMLTEKEKVAEAVAMLEEWVGPAVDVRDIGDDSSIVVGTPISAPERIQKFAAESGLSKPDQMKLFGTLTGNLTDALRSDDADIAKRAGLLLSTFAEAASRMAGNEPPSPTPPMSQAQAHRLMQSLSFLHDTVQQSQNIAIGQQAGSIRAQRDRIREDEEGEGGIFSGSIFGNAGHRDDEDW